MLRDEDFFLGVDIERVWILVNEYLDNKILNVEEVDQIFGRWENFFGENNYYDYIKFFFVKKIICKEIVLMC